MTSVTIVLRQPQASSCVETAADDVQFPVEVIGGHLTPLQLPTAESAPCYCDSDTTAEESRRRSHRRPKLQADFQLDIYVKSC